MGGEGEGSFVSANTGAIVVVITGAAEEYNAGTIESTDDSAIEEVLPVPDRDKLTVGGSDADSDGAGETVGTAVGSEGTDGAEETVGSADGFGETDGADETVGPGETVEVTDGPEERKGEADGVAGIVVGAAVSNVGHRIASDKLIDGGDTGEKARNV